MDEVKTLKKHKVLIIMISILLIAAVALNFSGYLDDFYIGRPSGSIIPESIRDLLPAVVDVFPEGPESTVILVIIAATITIITILIMRRRKLSRS